MRNVVEYPAEFRFKEEYIPPRCRKPRFRETQSQTMVKIPVVEAAEAPVAMYHMDGLASCSTRHRKEYRWYNGNLYEREKILAFNDDGSLYRTMQTVSNLKAAIRKIFLSREPRDEQWHPVHTLEEAKAAIQREYDKYLLIKFGGRTQVWSLIGEPRYCICTFGLGHNHGGIGTSLGIENQFNPNIGKERYFDALHWKEAKAEAMRIAKCRGDTNSFKYIRKAEKIKVLIPEAVTVNTEDAGEGNPFINKLNAITEVGSDALTTGLLAIAITDAEIKKSEERAPKMEE